MKERKTGVMLITVNSNHENLIVEKMSTFYTSLYQMDKQKWRELEDLVNKCQNDFMLKLRLNFPFLSEDDFHIILLLRIGLSHTQISEVINVLKSSFRIRRSRLKKKMGVKCDSISEYIRNLQL